MMHPITGVEPGQGLMKHDHPRLKLLVAHFLSHGEPALVCGLIVLCASVAAAAEQEPSYKGRLLSQWLEDVIPSEVGSPQRPPSEAIRAMGTNAVPTLLKWISYERSAPQQPSQTEEAAPRHLSPEERADRTRDAFWALGAVARPAIPELTRLARTSSDPWRAERCAISLAFIGPEAIPNLLSLATNGPPWTRYSAVGGLERFAGDPEGVQTLPVLIQCLTNTQTSYPVGGSAQRVLLSMDPAVAIPALTNALRSSSAQTRLEVARCLLLFEAVADPRLPSEIPTMVTALRAAMRDPDYPVRVAATNLLRRMGGWELVGEQWVRRHGTNTLYGITPDFFTDGPPR